LKGTGAEGTSQRKSCEGREATSPGSGEEMKNTVGEVKVLPVVKSLNRERAKWWLKSSLKRGKRVGKTEKKRKKLRKKNKE